MARGCSLLSVVCLCDAGSPFVLVEEGVEVRPALDQDP